LNCLNFRKSLIVNRLRQNGCGHFDSGNIDQGLLHWLENEWERRFPRSRFDSGYSSRCFAGKKPHFSMKAAVGFGPTNNGFANRRLNRLATPPYKPIIICTIPGPDKGETGFFHTTQSPGWNECVCLRPCREGISLGRPRPMTVHRAGSKGSVTS
jgi:hypothetical protein